MGRSRIAPAWPLKGGRGACIVAEIIGLDHVQLAMPAGQESLARDFYAGVLGLLEEPKPPNLAARGLANLADRCRSAGYPPVTDEPLEGFNRVYVFDPFGNRIELIEAM